MQYLRRVRGVTKMDKINIQIKEDLEMQSVTDLVQISKQNGKLKISNLGFVWLAFVEMTEFQYQHCLSNFLLHEFVQQVSSNDYFGLFSIQDLTSLEQIFDYKPKYNKTIGGVQIYPIWYCCNFFSSNVVQCQKINIFLQNVIAHS